MKSYMPILILVLSVGLYFLYTGPELSDIKGLMAKKAEYENVLSRAQDLASKRDTILAQYNNIPQDEITRLNAVIPDTYKSEMFANDVNNLASQEGLTLKSVKDTNSNPTDRTDVTDTSSSLPYKINLVTLDMTGSYSSFVKFLADLESNLRLIDVNALSIKALSDAKSGQISSYEFTLAVNVYSLK